MRDRETDEQLVRDRETDGQLVRDRETDEQLVRNRDKNYKKIKTENITCIHKLFGITYQIFQKVTHRDH